jgi:hypothetical protein
MSQPSLSGAAVNLAALREHGQNELIDVLDSIRGKKALVLDPHFTGPLGLVAGVSMLKEHGVERIYHLSSAPLQADSKNVLYLVRPKVEYMKWIAQHVRAARASKGLSRVTSLLKLHSIYSFNMIVFFSLFVFELNCVEKKNQNNHKNLSKKINSAHTL